MGLLYAHTQQMTSESTRNSARKVRPGCAVGRGRYKAKSVPALNHLPPVRLHSTSLASSIKVASLQIRCACEEVVLQMANLESSSARPDATSIEPSTHTPGSIYILSDWPQIKSTRRPGHYLIVSEVGGSASEIYTVAHCFRLDVNEVGQDRLTASLMIPSQWPRADSPYLNSSKSPLTPVRLALSNNSALGISREGGQAKVKLSGAFWLHRIGVEPVKIRAQAGIIDPAYAKSVDQQLGSLHEALVSLSGEKIPV